MADDDGTCGAVLLVAGIELCGLRQVGFGGGVVLVFERSGSFKVKLAGLVCILRLRGFFRLRAGQRRGDGSEDRSVSLRRCVIDAARWAAGFLCPTY